MQTIMSTLSDFWSNLTGYVSADYITILTTVSVITLLYFVFVRAAMSLFKWKSARKITDILFLVITIAIVIKGVFPQINIVKEVTEIVSQTP